MSEQADRSSVPLRRTLGTATLTLHGVGVMVGAGIFVLVGEVAGHAGTATWLAFIAASLAALPTGLSYAELASRYPRSAGEAVFAARAFDRSGVSFVVGFLVVASGLMSTAAVSHGFAEYAHVLLGSTAIPRAALIVAFLGALSIINDRGIRQSTWLNAALTSVSVLALLAIAFAGVGEWGRGPEPVLPTTFDVAPVAILSAAALAFYAFIGFEDICNVAEETRAPSRTIPRAVLLSLGISAALYAVVTLTALSVVPAAELASHPAPLTLVAERVFPWVTSWWIAVVAILAVTSTALFNLIMASRVLLGMARSGWLPAALGNVGTRTRTPRLSIAVAFGFAVILALTGVLGVLAEATNVIILLAFVAVNVSLLAIRIRKVAPDQDAGPTFRVPLVVPILGVGLNLLLLAQLSWPAYARAAVLIGVGVVLHLIVRAGREPSEPSETSSPRCRTRTRSTTARATPASDRSGGQAPRPADDAQVAALEPGGRRLRLRSTRDLYRIVPVDQKRPMAVRPVGALGSAGLGSMGRTER